MKRNVAAGFVTFSLSFAFFLLFEHHVLWPQLTRLTVSLANCIIFFVFLCYCKDEKLDALELFHEQNVEQELFMREPDQAI